VRRLSVSSPRITGYAIAPSTVSVPSVAASYAGSATARKSWNVRRSAKGVVRVTTSAIDPLPSRVPCPARACTRAMSMVWPAAVAVTSMPS
jgi:hypothetical protein